MTSPGFNSSQAMQNANRATADAASRARQASDQSYRALRRGGGSLLGSLVSLVIALAILAFAAPFVVHLITQFVHAAH